MDNSNQILDIESKNINSIDINPESTKVNNINTTLNNIESTKIANIEADSNEEKNTPEVSEEETPSESIDIKPEDANTTNCLALTIQEEHKLVAVKNVFLRSVRMSWKVIVSSITLAIIKLLS